MRWNHRGIVILAVLAGALLAGRPASSAETGKRPNFVVFLSDDHGYLDSTPYGATDVRTPSMARLAHAGLRFTHAFIASPACAPSRAALMTGLMPARNSTEANHTQPRADLKTLPAYLQECGYDVAAFGKVIHGRDAARYGFDHHEPGYTAELVAKYLERRAAAKPLCLFVGTHQPHVPWPENRGYDPSILNLPPTFVDTPETREVRACYYTDVEQADTELGEIYDLALKKLHPNTLFIYTSDHGAQWPFGKWNLYDSGTRSPLIAAWPGVIEPGATSGAMLSWIDLLPTFVELAGGAPPQDIDGRSFAGVLRGKTDRHRDRIFTTHSGDGRMNVYPIRSVRTRDWKYLLNLKPAFAHTTHIDKARGKDGLKYWLPWQARAKTDAHAAAVVKRYYERPREELYDLRADPHEQRNLATDAAHAKRLAAFRAEVQAWMKAQGDEGKVFNTPRLLTDPGATTGAKLDAPAKPGAAAKASQTVLPPEAATATWRYTTAEPAAGWEKADFDDAAWKTGKGGFGKLKKPDARVRTTWLTENIWLRREFELKRPLKRPALLILHDEDAEVYLNGARVASLKGFAAKYILVPLDADARQALREGPNLLAVHCQQKSGGQYIDVIVVDAAKTGSVK